MFKNKKPQTNYNFNLIQETKLTLTKLKTELDLTPSENQTINELIQNVNTSYNNYLYNQKINSRQEENDLRTNVKQATNFLIEQENKREKSKNKKSMQNQKQDTKDTQLDTEILSN